MFECALNFLDAHQTIWCAESNRNTHSNAENSCSCSFGAYDRVEQIRINHRHFCWYVLTFSEFWFGLLKHMMYVKHAEDAHLHVYCDVLPYKECLRMSGKFSLWFLNIRWIVIIIRYLLGQVWTHPERNKRLLVLIRSRSCAPHGQDFELDKLARNPGRGVHMTWPYLADHIC